MPIVKTDKGWYWGSKEPFKTKGDALAVARGAYAHGYKENIMESNLSAFIQNLLHCVTNAHLLHLQTRSYAKHVALGDFYEGLDDLVDGLAETVQGKVGILRGYNTNYDLPAEDPIQYLEQISAYIEASRMSSWFPQESNVQNEIDTIISLIDSTLYKLRNLD